MNWRTTLGLVLLVAAILSGWSAWKNREVPEPNQITADRSDYVMRDFEMIALNSQGTEAVAVRAPEMARNPADQTFAITTPLFLLPEQDGRSWELRAKTGWLSAKGEELRLRGDVRGDSPIGSLDPTQFRTDSLNVFLNEDTARTSDVVTITQPGVTMTGRGFSVNIKSKAYVLESQVHTKYTARRR